MLYENLNETELINIICGYQVCKGLRRYKVKMNFFAIMMKHLPGEYNIKKDKPFFDKYKNKEVFAYGSNGKNHSDGWFILEDDNYCLLKECFEEIKEA